MATITPTVSDVAKFRDNATLASYEFSGSGDTGVAMEQPGSAIRSVQIAGTFDSATVVVEGSNDGTNYVTLTDPQGNAISKTAAAIEAIEEVTRYVRPRSSGGGANTALTISFMLVRRGS
jgi:hypothetical protein